MGRKFLARKTGRVYNHNNQTPFPAKDDAPIASGGTGIVQTAFRICSGNEKTYPVKERYHGP